MLNILRFVKSSYRVFKTSKTGIKTRNIQCVTKIKNDMNHKPPNILVFTGNNSPEVFKNIENNILHCLKTHSYLVYHLMLSEVEKQLWIENTLLLVVSCDEIDDSTAAIFENYFNMSGRILLSCSKFNNLAGIKCVERNAKDDNLTQVNFKNIGEVSVYRNKYSYYSPDCTVLYHDSENIPVIHRICDKGVFIASEIYLVRDLDFSSVNVVLPNYDKQKKHLILKSILGNEFGLETENGESSIPHLSSGYFISDKFEQSLLDLNDSSENPLFRECSLNYLENKIKLPIYYQNKKNIKFINFEKSIYFDILNTDMYGHHLIYFPVISSTMDVVEQLSDYEGIVIVSSCQLSGKGRGGNKWISPTGCAMFTLYFTFPLFSNLGQKLPLIQHIAALAVVHGIRNQRQYRNLNLKIKWPNDIYFDGCKLGGLIVSSTIQGKEAHISVGWGINVANNRPTICVNDAIRKYNLENSCNLPCLHIEEVIASTISQMEYFIKDFQKFSQDKFFCHYYSYWLHGNQRVTLSNYNEEGTVTGLDNYGFLIVKTDKGEEMTLQPDGNRFDIMKNLIYTRK